MGMVYLAHDEALLRPTAVKVLSWTPTDSLSQNPEEWFLAEARSVARVNHPAVVQIYSAAKHGNYCYIAMEYVDGESGDALVAGGGPLSAIDATQVVLQIAGAVDQAHACGIIHRDIKPANVFIKDDGTAKLGDFGMALQAESTPAQAATPVGTPHYIAPELWRGTPASALSDIYALGATYFFFLTGRPPYDLPDLSALIDAHQTAPIPNPSTFRRGTCPDCARIIHHCLAKAPHERYQSAQELAWELRGVLRHLNGRTPAPVDVHPEATLKIAVQDHPAVPWAVTLGLTGRPFTQVDASQCPYDGSPLREVREQLRAFVQGEPGGTLILLGARGSGRSMLVRQTLAEAPAETPLSYLDLAYGAKLLKAGHTLPQWACRALGALPSGSPGRDVYLEGLIEQLSASPRPALLVFDSVPEEAPYAKKLSSLVRAARSTKCMSLIVVGTPDHVDQLTNLGGLLEGDIRTLEVPSLDTAQTGAYLEAWLEATRDPTAPLLMLTPDAITLVHHRTEGNLARLNTLTGNMLQMAALENRRVLTSWYAWRAPADDNWVAEKDSDLRRPSGWPLPEVLELLKKRRQQSGIPERSDPPE
jgi:type II secretory pathway predicted ATPase ExeA